MIGSESVVSPAESVVVGAAGLLSSLSSSLLIPKVSICTNVTDIYITSTSYSELSYEKVRKKE